jgi:hypothetical protein
MRRTTPARLSWRLGYAVCSRALRCSAADGHAQLNSAKVTFLLLPSVILPGSNATSSCRNVFLRLLCASAFPK